VNYRGLLFCFVIGLLPICASARDAKEQARIDFIIHDVETSQGLKFIRNGSEYDGAAAAKHLRMKLNYAGDRVKTAEDFIKYCATESSLTHQKYTVRTSNGKVRDSAAYFTERLHVFDRGKE
jgi:hypothetical protein